MGKYVRNFRSSGILRATTLNHRLFVASATIVIKKFDEKKWKYKFFAVFAY